MTEPAQKVIHERRRQFIEGSFDHDRSARGCVRSLVVQEGKRRESERSAATRLDGGVGDE